MPTARTEPGDPVDELPPPGVAAVAFSSPRRSLWGTGEALRIEVPAPWPDHVGVVAKALEAIAHEGPQAPGRGPVAFGALPYDRRSAATLVVPAFLHGRTSDGDRWTTRIEGPGIPTHELIGDDVAPHRQPGTVVVEGGRVGQWVHGVVRAVQHIRQGALTKVVLAREITVTGDGPFDAPTLLRRMRRAAPASFAYSVDGFVGATPELLVSRIGDVVRAHPMAGTLPRTGDPDADARRAGELLGSHKNRVEHQITIDMVHDTLLPWCSYLDAEPEPSIVAAGPVQHLASLVEGRLSQPEPSVLELVAALHPTPAVGGWPRAEALALQAELEGVDRGRYAGPVGWVDAAGNGVFGVGIRGVQLDGAEARLFAGVGVVAESDPEAELEETRAKAQAVLSALTRV
ncbi:isochorismate synthase [Dermatobacter hominis]|uniref:isochorismate synthase n=1 Tax=Dermatobacter hominis TaxID=2884263 RepID=UPI001D113FBD|nr:isochorismate synthase [Dermatobacter hominis]UDY36010.1 isochorismate synthase [Dermatobacter hominis]